MKTIQKIFLALRFIGLRASLRTLMYTLYRDLLEWRYDQHPENTPKISPGTLQEVTPQPNGARCAFQNGVQLEIHFLAPEVVRLTWKPGRILPPYALAEAQHAPPQQVELTTRRESDQTLHISSAGLSLTLLPDGRLLFSSPDGKTLREELPPSRQGSGWQHQALLPPTGRLFGLGERAAASSNGTFPLWNTDPGGSYGPKADPLYMPLPIYYCTQTQGGYLLFYENPNRGEIHIDEQVTARFEAGALRYYFILGSPASALEQYTRLTGRPPLPPRWALGFHQSRWGYKSEADIREVVEGFRTHNLPLSAIHLDIDYMEGYRVFTVDKTRFPNLRQLADDLAEEGIRLVTILDPGVKRDPNYEVYTQGIQEGVFCKLPRNGNPEEGKTLHGLVWPGWCAFPDFTHPKTRRWWGSYYRQLLEAGIAGFWHDMNEPTAFSAWGEPTLPRVTHHNLEGEGGSHIQAHNLYGLLMNRAGYEALRQLRPQQRPWLLSRSGWLGLQRYAWHWTGDTESTWEALRMTIATMIHLGLSGISFSGPDIGGFSGAPDAELFTRWFQLATFMPFFRNHAAVGTPRREPWSFGEPTLSICREFLRLRQRLMPYLYTLAWQAHQSGAPLVRPLFWNEPDNRELWGVMDEFLLGDSLLVAPILEAGATSRRVVLPPGGWYDFWEGERFEGGASLQVSAPLERIPLFVRQGTILPLAEADQVVLQPYPDPTGAAQGVLYSDAGEGYGPWRVERLALQPDGEIIHTTEGEGDSL